MNSDKRVPISKLGASKEEDNVNVTTATLEDGVLLDPAQEFGDVIERKIDLGQKFSLKKERCNMTSNFMKSSTNSTESMDVLSIVWTVPHPMGNDTLDKYYYDARGEIVEFLRSGISFKNVTNQPVTIHANCPVALQHVPTKIYARLAGFRRRAGGKTTVVDSMRLDKGKPATFKINWKNLPNEYTPLVWDNPLSLKKQITVLNFAVEYGGINLEAGVPYDKYTPIVSIIPKCQYSVRKIKPTSSGSATSKFQEMDNSNGVYELHDLAGGSHNLYDVDPVPFPDTATGGRKVISSQLTSKYLFSDPPVSMNRQASTEGKFMGYHLIQAKNIEGKLVPLDQADYLRPQDGESTEDFLKRVEEAGVKCIKALSVAEKPEEVVNLRIPGLQQPDVRVIMNGINASAGSDTLWPDLVPNFGALMYYAWSREIEAWVQWDEVNSCPLYSSPYEEGMPVALSTMVPLTVVSDAVYGMETNDFGQRIGSPKAFGTVIATILFIVISAGKGAKMLNDAMPDSWKARNPWTGIPM